MEIGKGFYFNGAQTPLIYYFLFGTYLYLPWFVMSVVAGMLASTSLSYSVFHRRSLLLHLPVAISFALIHVLVLTSAYWLFWPERVSRVTFQFVLGEQAVKWVHFELLAYFILLFLWRRQLSSETDPGNRNGAEEGDEQLALTTDAGVIRLDKDQVDWLLADDNYVIVHANERQLRVRGTMKEMLRQLHADHFQQAHRSAIVNMRKVREIGNQRVVLESGCRVPVSRRRHRKLLEAFNRLK